MCQFRAQPNSFNLSGTKRKRPKKRAKYIRFESAAFLYGTWGFKEWVSRRRRRPSKAHEMGDRLKPRAQALGQDKHLIAKPAPAGDSLKPRASALGHQREEISKPMKWATAQFELRAGTDGLSPARAGLMG